MTTPNTPTVVEIIEFEKVFAVSEEVANVMLVALQEAVKLLKKQATCEVPTRRTELMFQMQAKEFLAKWGFK